MLRRKLLLTMGGLTLMLVATALGAVWPLQRLFNSLDRMNRESRQIMQLASDLHREIGAIEVELYELQSGRTTELDQLIDHVERLTATVGTVGQHPIAGDPQTAPLYQRLVERQSVLRRQVGRLATVQEPALARQHKAASLLAAAELRADILAIGRAMQGHVQRGQAAATGRFRWLVIAMALAFLLVIDLAVILLLRATGMVLRPVDRLVDASRRLAGGDLSCRVAIDQRDEFGELARAFNHLGEQLEQQDRRRMETLGHAALTLNHELNNAMAAIAAQLQLLGRQRQDDPRFQERLHQIHGSLQRMAGVVESLKHVQQIVLTDYSGGLKMLDLERSTQVPGTAGTADDADR